ncbi:hypothetical protein ILYODFUR_035438, partial [Ilyodon furcidens]
MYTPLLYMAPSPDEDGDHWGLGSGRRVGVRAGSLRLGLGLLPLLDQDLLSRVEGQISLRDTNYRRCIPAAERLSICL